MLLSIMMSFVATFIILIFADQLVKLGASMTWFARFFLGAMTVIVLWMAWLAIRALRNAYQGEQRITRIVGLHPSQLPGWKWRQLAKPIALKKLSEVANSLQTLTLEETALLSSQNPDPKELLDFDREVNRKKKEFWELQALFLKFGIDVPKKSWVEFSF